MKGRLEYRTMQSLRSAPEPLQITIQGKLPRQPYVRRTDITNILFNRGRTRGINPTGPAFLGKRIFNAIRTFRQENLPQIITFSTI